MAYEWLIAHALVVYLVYRDIEYRDMNQLLWLLLVILIPVLGVLLYLIFRQPKNYVSEY